MRYQGQEVEIFTDLHCGACGDHFDNTRELASHISTCPAAIVLLPLFYNAAFNHIIGHPYAGWVMYIQKARSIIKQYAMAITNDMDNLNRAKLHLELCETLHIDHRKFKPFESPAIKDIPTYEQAKRILWFAIEEEFVTDVENYKRKIGYKG